MVDEGPSADDLDRFSDELAFCPDCGSRIWDQAEICPVCGSLVGGRTTGRPPVDGWLRRRWLVLVAIIALIAFVLWAVL